MRRAMILALSLAIALPAVAAAQRPDGRQPRGDREMPMRRPMGGVAMLLEHADELKLTSDQVTRLKTIQTRFEERTAPLRARADSLRPDRDGERRDLDATELRRRRQAAADLMTQMREENQTARGEAMALLSGDQQKKVQELEEARRKEAESRRGRRGGGNGGRRGGGGPPRA